MQWHVGYRSSSLREIWRPGGLSLVQNRHLTWMFSISGAGTIIPSGAFFRWISTVCGVKSGRGREKDFLANTVVNSQKTKKVVATFLTSFVLYNFESGTVVWASSANLTCIQIHSSLAQIHILDVDRWRRGYKTLVNTDQKSRHQSSFTGHNLAYIFS